MKRAPLILVLALSCTHDVNGNLRLTPGAEAVLEVAAEDGCVALTTILAGGVYAGACPGAEGLLAGLLDQVTAKDAGAPDSGLGTATAAMVTGPLPSDQTHKAVHRRTRKGRRKLGTVPHHLHAQVQALADQLPLL